MNKLGLLALTGGSGGSNITLSNIIDKSTNKAVTPKAVYDKLQDYNIKTYTKPEQLGLADGCSVGDIFMAMPNNSYFECGVNIAKTDVLYNIEGVPNKGGE